MTSREFVIWFKGFVEAANTYNITPKQWDVICEYLERVKEPGTGTSYTISNNRGNYGTTNTTARMDVTYKTDDLTTDTVF